MVNSQGNVTGTGSRRVVGRIFHHRGSNHADRVELQGDCSDLERLAYQSRSEPRPGDAQNRETVPRGPHPHHPGHLNGDRGARGDERGRAGGAGGHAQRTNGPSPHPSARHLTREEAYRVRIPPPGRAHVRAEDAAAPSEHIPLCLFGPGGDYRISFGPTSSGDKTAPKRRSLGAVLAGWLKMLFGW